MIQNWEIRDIHSNKNKKFSLLIDGNSYDAQLIFRKMEDICSPPVHSKEPPYKYKFSLTITDNELKKTEERVKELVEKSEKLDKLIPEEDKNAFESLIDKTEMNLNKQNEIKMSEMDKELEELEQLKREIEEEKRRDETINLESTASKENLRGKLEQIRDEDSLKLANEDTLVREIPDKFKDFKQIYEKKEEEEEETDSNEISPELNPKGNLDISIINVDEKKKSNEPEDEEEKERSRIVEKLNVQKLREEEEAQEKIREKDEELEEIWQDNKENNKEFTHKEIDPLDEIMKEEPLPKKSKTIKPIPKQKENEDKAEIKKKDSDYNLMEDSMLIDELEDTILNPNTKKEETEQRKRDIKEKIFSEILENKDSTITNSEDIDSLIKEITNSNEDVYEDIGEEQMNNTQENLEERGEEKIKEDKTENSDNDNQQESLEKTEEPKESHIEEEEEEEEKKEETPIESEEDIQKDKEIEENKEDKEEVAKKETVDIPPPPPNPALEGIFDKTKTENTEKKENTDLLNKPLPPITTQKNMNMKKKPLPPEADEEKKYESIELPEDDKEEDHKWPLEMPLIPTYTFENMIIGSNRFAHATTTTVINSLGQMYNPLFLYGNNGTGKTHFLNAIAYEASKNIGLDKIFMTNGVRFSRGIQRYISEDKVDKLEEFIKKTELLLVDDIHLMAVNKQNKDLISKWFNTFIKEEKQIVLSSKYPPASLSKLGELINFKFEEGWTSQLKYPSETNLIKILKKQLISSKIDLEDEAEIARYFDPKDTSLSKASRIIRRAKVLHNLMRDSGKDISSKEVLDLILATNGEDNQSSVVKEDFSQTKTVTKIGNGEWGKIGFFYPYGSSQQMKWMVYALSQRASELEIPGGFEIGLKSAYKTENIISSAFKIANVCDNRKLKGAVILGPSRETCSNSIRSNFYDILTHMLEIMLIRCGIVNYEDLKRPSSFTKILTEILK